MGGQSKEKRNKLDRLKRACPHRVNLAVQVENEANHCAIIMALTMVQSRQTVCRPVLAKVPQFCENCCVMAKNNPEIQKNKRYRELMGDVGAII